MKISEFAEQYAWLPEEENAESGKYRLSRMPHQRAMLDDPLRQGCRKYVWMIASQLGKTHCMIVRTTYAIKKMKRSILFSRPTKDTAASWMRDKFLPTVAAMPCMRQVLVEPRKRGGNSVGTNRRYEGGSIKIVGAKSPAAFRGSTVPIVEKDEVDSYEVTKEGDPCALLDRATITFQDAWNCEASTPTLVGISKIHENFLQGDQQKFFVPCPCCGEMEELDFWQLKFSFTAEEYARFPCDPSLFTWERGDFSIVDTKRAIYVCSKCHHGWTDAMRIRSYRSEHEAWPAVKVGGRELRADWRATAPFTGITSRHMSGMYQTIGLKPGMLNYLHQFAAQFLEAKKGGREKLQVWWNLFLGLPFEEPSEKLDWKVIADRAENYDATAELPAQVVWIDFGMDIQQDRVEILFNGWGDAQEVWCLDHHIEYGDFDMPSMQERVGEYLLNKRFKHPILGEMIASAGGIDSGKQTKVQAVYAFSAKYRLQNWFSVKGFDSALGALFQREHERRYGGTRFNFNVDSLKSMVFDRLRNTEPGPRFIHFPKERGGKFGAGFYHQLCSERRVPERQKNGSVIWHWKKHTSSTRNEVLDMMVYSLGIFEVCRQDDWIARKWREVQAKLRELNPPAPAEKREMILNQPAEAKLPELKERTPDRRPAARRKIRISSPFSRFSRF